MSVLLPWITRLVLAVPIGLGLAFTMASAFGLAPGFVALDGPSLDPWREMVATPGLARSLWLSFSVGLTSTAAALASAVMMAAAWHGTRTLTIVRRWLPPTLAIPHAAFAIGLAFLIAPSGWLVRLISPWLTGWDQPPDVASVRDAHGLALTLALICKEVPFLSLALIAALGGGGRGSGGGALDEGVRAARIMGYGPVTAWLKVALPAVYPLIRLPVLVTLTYGVSAADPAIILGPTTPPTLMVAILRANADAEPALHDVAAAMALLQLAVACAAICLWLVMERLAARLFRPWMTGGGRGGDGSTARLVSGGATLVIGVLLAGSILSLVTWSVTDVWRYPNPLPTAWSLDVFTRVAPGLLVTTGSTLAIALTTTAVALVLVIGCLESEGRGGRVRRPLAFIWIVPPLIMPQATFLVGAQIGMLAAGGDGGFPMVVWAHLLQTLPYVHLVLADPWRAFDSRIERQARALGATRARFLWRVKLPMLTRPVAIAAAVGFAVSVGQYLPTLFAGGGRIATLATETVALSSGGDRREMAVHGLTQATVPAIGFALALAVPAWAFRNRKGMAVR